MGPNKQQYSVKHDIYNRQVSPFMPSGQETEQVYSYNPGARTWQKSEVTAGKQCSQWVSNNYYQFLIIMILNIYYYRLGPYL